MQGHVLCSYVVGSLFLGIVQQIWVSLGKLLLLVGWVNYVDLDGHLLERVLGQGCSAVPWPSCQPSNASITIGKAPRKIG
jgi:hypothetical protein